MITYSMQSPSKNLEDRLLEYVHSGRESVASQKMLRVLHVLAPLNISTVLDVGSWHLKQSLEMLHAFPEAKIHAFEPAPDNFRLCEQTHLNMNPAERSKISLWNMACGSDTGVIDFFTIDETLGDSNAGAASKYKFKPGLNGSFYNQHWVQKQIQAQQIKLDDWQIQHKIGPVDLMWIDVQGGELDVFQGAACMLDDVKIIFTEVGLQAYYEGQSLKPQIDEFLAAKGFREITEAFELNGFEYEGNTVYVRV